MNEQQKSNITVEEAFQKSVNIRYDYGNAAKVKDYIASQDSLELLGKFVWSTASHAVNRSNILIGAYGRGKSHLILVLLTLLCAKDRSSCAHILAQVKEYDVDLYDYLQDYIENNQRLLPIIISGNSDSISQSFLKALQEALQRESLDDLMPNTHFDAALKMIRSWKTDYPETYCQFERLIGEPVTTFELNLHEFNEHYYKTFVSLYPTLTSGSTFNPFTNMDIVDLYSDVTEKLHEFGYEGLFVVYDEFSKYLEANIKTASISDTKLLQDFAEKATRSGSRQMHLLLITHKDIHNYIDMLPKEKTDGWRGIAERFEHHEMSGNVEQTYELIGKVICKDNDYYTELKKQYANAFYMLYADVQEQKLFIYKTKDEIKALVDECYPLHPVTLFLLPRISEKVAQNERTLFTFLASNQKHTLKEFLQNQGQEFFWMTPDYIYDYFEPQFKKESYQSEIRKIYTTASSALKRVEKNSIQEKIIKTLAVVSICNEVNVLPANDTTLAYVYLHVGYSNIELAEALTTLLNTHLLYRESNSGFLVLKDGMQYNMEQLITDTVEKIKMRFTVEEILNKAMTDKYFYPTRYNEDCAITRYFRFDFINETVLYKGMTLDKTSDGVIYGIILNTDSSVDEVRKYLTQNDSNTFRQVFVLPKEYHAISDIAYRYQAIIELRESNVYEGSAKEELIFQQEDMEIVLKNFFIHYTIPEQLKSEYYHNGHLQSIYRKTQLTNLLSNICYNTYDKTPIINNEMINKDTVEKSIVSARNKIVDGLLETHLQPMLGLSGNGAEVSLTRALLVNSGILEETEEGVKVRTHGLADENLQYVFDTIYTFFNQACQQKVSFEALYDKLILPTYRIGLKKGVIPVFLAAALHDLKSQVLIEKQEKEVELSAELLLSIDENPGAYTVMLENWDEERQAYIASLEEMFAQYVVEKEKQFNGFTYVFKAMQRWFLSMPKVSKNMTRRYDPQIQEFVDYSAEMTGLLQLLRQQDLGAQKFLFTDLLQLFADCDSLTCVVGKIGDLKVQFDRNYTLLVEGIVTALKREFSTLRDVQDVSLQPIWQDWYEANKNRIANADLTNQQERIAFIMNQDKTEQNIAQDLAKEIIGLRLIDWQESHLSIFLQSIAEYKMIVAMASNKEVINELNTTLALEGEVSDLSASGKLLLNDLRSLFEEEYGDAVTNREKRIVIAEILKML